MSTLADILMLLHLLWVLFMILGLPLGILSGSRVIRWGQLAGMLVTGFFAVSGSYCPLTTWEEALRWQADPGFSYRGSFLAEHLSPILYPQIDPLIIRAASVTWMLLTVVAIFVWKPGER